MNATQGCGKSSTCFHLAGYFARMGIHVLLVDADPQGSLSRAFFGSEDVAKLSAAESLPVATPMERISLVRANQTLARHTVPSPVTARVKQDALREFLQTLEGYDIILIDCPPNLYQESWNAMLAADYVVIPIPPEDLNVQELRVIHEAIVNAHRLMPGLRLLGHIVTRHDARLPAHRSFEGTLRALYGESVLDSVIPESSAFRAAFASGQPVCYGNPNSQAAEWIAQLGKELLKRIAYERPSIRIADDSSMIVTACRELPLAIRRLREGAANQSSRKHSVRPPLSR